jgi:hypothetical protein
VQVTILCRVMELLAVHQCLVETESGHLLAVSVFWSELKKNCLAESSWTLCHLGLGTGSVYAALLGFTCIAV